ncbi:MAG: hypothetical protein JXB43_07125 [Dehalococcoidia bacterium]|nr:hypothetical protein [Dehalococcoidia bacterium]
MNDILSEMAEGLAEIRLIAIVDIDSMVLAYWESPQNNRSPEGLGGFIRQINSTINAFKQSATQLTSLSDVILNTPSGYMIFKPIFNDACFIVVDAPGSVSLGSIRTACSKYTPRLEQAIPGNESLPQSDRIETIVP